MALENITMNKVSGGDGISAELFQILKGDAVKVLHSICQQIWNTSETNTFLINYFLLRLVTELCLTLLLQRSIKTFKNLLK